MVDLKELQREIDELLESETDESLLNWYMSKKFPDYKKILGEGDFIDFGLSEFCIGVEPSKSNKLVFPQEATTSDNIYDLAA